MQVYQAAVDDFDREMARILRVNPTDLRCLEILTTEPESEVTPRALARRLNLTTGSVTTMLDRLERVGYITRERHPSDRRQVLVRSTAQVRQAIWGHLEPMLEESFATVSQRFTAQELDAVGRFLAEATELEDRHVERLRQVPAGG